MLRRGWRWKDVEEGMEVGSCRGVDGGGELFRRGWRWGDTEEVMEARSC